jgi:drug/metabolite transporter, DME family
MVRASMRDRTRARLQLVAAAVLFSTGGAAIKECSLGTWQVAGFRSAIAALALFLGSPRSARGWTGGTWLVGAVYSATLILFVAATKLTTAASAIFIQDSAPLYILLLAPWLLRERIARHDFLAMLLVASGLTLFFLSPDRAVASAPDPWRGNLLAAGSGVSWALTVIGLRWLGARQGGGELTALRAVVCGNLLAFAACLPAALPVEHFALADGLALAYLGVFQIGVAYFLLTRGIRHVPALEASLLLLIEPVLNPLFAWWGQGEVPGALSLVGGALILSATLVKTWFERRAPAASTLESG